MLQRDRLWYLPGCAGETKEGAVGWSERLGSQRYLMHGCLVAANCVLPDTVVVGLAGWVVVVAVAAVVMRGSAHGESGPPAAATSAAVHSIPEPKCPVSFADTAVLPSFATEPVVAVRKKEWERSLGGEQAAVPFIKQRLRAWPRAMLVDTHELPADDRELAWRFARDTWRGIAAMTDRENGLPIDDLRFPAGSLDVSHAKIGDYASGSSIGLYLMAAVAARDLGLITTPEAAARIDGVLATLRSLEHYRGFLFNFYDTTSLERTSNFVSFVDAAWLTAGLIVVRNAVPDSQEACTAMIEGSDYKFFWDERTAQLSHGYYVNKRVASPFHYGMLYTEARLGALIAIGKGEIPELAWFNMVRTYPSACKGQRLTVVKERRKQVGNYELTAGFAQWSDLRYVPSWGGSMFEALMPTLVLDEQQLAPESLGANDAAHLTIQRRYAADVLQIPVWGASPCSTADGTSYAEYGVPVLGARGYSSEVVTPHASALALAVDPAAALDNLRTLAKRYDIYGDFGFYDAVDPRSGRVARAYLTLDQSMFFLALANYLGNGAVQRWFASDPIMQRVLPLLSDEAFFD